MDGTAALLEGFGAHLRARNYSPSSVGAYGLHLKGFFGWLSGKGVVDMRRVGKAHLWEYQRCLFEEPGVKVKRYRWGTVSAKVRALRRFFGWLEEEGKVLVNPATALRERANPNPLPRRVLGEEEAARLMDGPDETTEKGIRDRALLETFYSTGLRLAEMAALTLWDVDLQGGTVRVNEGKGGKDRVVPLGDRAGEYLKAYLDKVRPSWVKGEGERRLWVGPKGGALSSQMVYLTVKGYVKAAGLVGVSPHILRHTFATLLVRNGADVGVVAKMLGHTDLKVTQGYVRVAARDVKKAVADHHPRERERFEVPEPEIRSIRPLEAAHA